MDEKVIDLMIVLLNFFVCCRLQAAKFATDQTPFLLCIRKVILFLFPTIMKKKSPKFIFIANSKFLLWSFSETWEGSAKSEKFWQLLERFLTENITKMELFLLLRQVFLSRTTLTCDNEV